MTTKKKPGFSIYLLIWTEIEGIFDSDWRIREIYFGSNFDLWLVFGICNGRSYR
jgi:hypothetical protein